ncbi:tRNA(His) guanylyltransferase Thg1 family protein [Lacipirellula sp.]|uniref:tRNA(His) guanylyltransferase Thg1 family protein n=1 Tax=Lacipirellula sp. TaxID=2691419 RepID=UPI003D0EBB2A
MKFDELDQKMRVFETVHDQCVLPGLWMVARLDGRNFTRLTKELQKFEVPFDERFRDLMVRTTEHVMNCGFRIIYGFTESDEISLLLDYRDRSFGRKTRKLNSVLAGEASAKFSLLLGELACLDCRISELPTVENVVDYFRWRNEDAHRNALNAHCYWSLRQEGESANAANDQLLRLSTSEKNEMLFRRGTNFNDLPRWQKRGVGLVWERYVKDATNAKTGEAVTASRRRITPIYELPMGDGYSDFVRKLLADETSES